MNMVDFFLLLSELLGSVLSWILQIVNADSIAEDLALDVFWFLGQKLYFFHDFIEGLLVNAWIIGGVINVVSRIDALIYFLILERLLQISLHSFHFIFESFNVFSHFLHIFLKSVNGLALLLGLLIQVINGFLAQAVIFWQVFARVIDI